MRNSTTINDLFNLANYLDKNGFLKEADYLDQMIKKIAMDLIPFDKERIKERSPEDSEESGPGELIEMSEPWVKRLKREMEEKKRRQALRRGAPAAPDAEAMPENIRERDLAEVILDSAGSDHSLLSELNLDDEGLSREEMIDRIVEYIALRREELAEEGKEEKGNYVIVLSDGETYDTDGYIVRVSDKKLERIEETSGKSIAELPPGDIKNIWDIIPESDMMW